MQIEGKKLESGALEFKVPPGFRSEQKEKRDLQKKLNRINQAILFLASKLSVEDRKHIEQILEVK